jgi:hypothetical protein
LDYSSVLQPALSLQESENMWSGGVQGKELMTKMWQVAGVDLCQLDEVKKNLMRILQLNREQLQAETEKVKKPSSGLRTVDEAFAAFESTINTIAPPLDFTSSVPLAHRPSYGMHGAGRQRYLVRLFSTMGFCRLASRTEQYDIEARKEVVEAAINRSVEYMDESGPKYLFPANSKLLELDNWPGKSMLKPNTQGPLFAENPQADVGSPLLLKGQERFKNGLAVVEAIKGMDDDATAVLKTKLQSLWDSSGLASLKDENGRVESGSCWRVILGDDELVAMVAGGSSDKEALEKGRK